MPLYVSAPPVIGTVVPAFRLLGANMDTTADQAMERLLPACNSWRVFQWYVTNASISLTTCQGTIYSGASKTGFQFGLNTTAFSAFTDPSIGTPLSGVTAANQGNAKIAVSTMFLALTIAQGSAATADHYVYGIILG